MSIFSRIGGTPRLVAAAAVSFSLFAGVAMAENGYVDVRVRDDSAGCGPVVLKWPADQEEREYDPNPGRNDPKLEMAETQPLPVIHHHPALNAGALYLPPQDGIYRHYFPESEAPPRLRRWNRAEYEEYLRENNPSFDIPLAAGYIPADRSVVPGMVIVPTGMVTAPVTFSGGPGGYVAVPERSMPEPESYVPAPDDWVDSPGAAIRMRVTPELPVVTDKYAEHSVTETKLPDAVQVQIIHPVARPDNFDLSPVPSRTQAAEAAISPGQFVNRESNGADEATGSFIKLSDIAEKVPFVGPATVSVSAPVAQPRQQAAAIDDVVTSPTTPFPELEPGDATKPMTTVGGACGAPVCR